MDLPIGADLRPSARTGLGTPGLGGSLLAAIGTGSVVFGLRRRSIPGAVVALVGAGLAYRGLTGVCLLERLRDVDAAARPRFRLSVSTHPAWSTVVMSTVTINRDPEPVFLFWRNPANLTLLHGPVTDVTPIDGRERWTIAGPGGVRGVLDMRLVEEVPLELLLWEAEGVGEGPWFSVELRAGPTRGTEVFVAARIPPPVPVRTARRLTGLLAQAELETMLRRARALLETGEFPTTEGQSSGRERVAPSGTPSVAER